MTGQRCRKTHYPSWGLETVCRNDWPAMQKDSLPLMGIGNHCASVVLIHRDGHSLPLMGIGNPTCKSGTYTPATPHYPSWGLETTWTGAHRSTRSGTHYPSWGLETPLPDAGVLHVCEGSLPLMGIGNFRQQQALPRRYAAHYPSWGLETARPTGGLWPCGPHYPSWGLETHSFALVVPKVPLSLPLMGIGNVTRLSPSVPSVPYSLPLMGIGNFPERHRDRPGP